MTCIYFLLALALLCGAFLFWHQPEEGDGSGLAIWYTSLVTAGALVTFFVERIGAYLEKAPLNHGHRYTRSMNILGFVIAAYYFFYLFVGYICIVCGWTGLFSVASTLGICLVGSYCLIVYMITGNPFGEEFFSRRMYTYYEKNREQLDSGLRRIATAFQWEQEKYKDWGIRIYSELIQRRVRKDSLSPPQYQEKNWRGIYLLGRQSMLCLEEEIDSDKRMKYYAESIVRELMKTKERNISALHLRNSAVLKRAISSAPLGYSKKVHGQPSWKRSWQKYFLCYPKKRDSLILGEAILFLGVIQGLNDIAYRRPGAWKWALMLSGEILHPPDVRCRGRMARTEMLMQLKALLCTYDRVLQCKTENQVRFESDIIYRDILRKYILIEQNINDLGCTISKEGWRQAVFALSGLWANALILESGPYEQESGDEGAELTIRISEWMQKMKERAYD